MYQFSECTHSYHRLLIVLALKNTFRKLDVDQDGRISKRDLRIACRKLGLLLTKDELQELYAEADIDGKACLRYNQDYETPKSAP